MKKRIKLNGIVLFLAVVVLVSFPLKIIRHADYMLDDFWEILGVSLILAGQLLRVSARGYKAEESRNGNSLVVRGPYALVRNPMYLGIILIGCGVVLAVLNLWVLLIFIGGFLLRYLYLFPKEEKVLRDAFGKSYIDYCKRVPRILPKVSFIYKKDIGEYIPVRLAWFSRELPSILVILAAVLIIKSWEEIRSGGWGFVAPAIAPLATTICLFFLIILFLSRRYENTPGKSKN
jgi:protein-S-isoprenylcysteine O-methyltransferase Ste14